MNTPSGVGGLNHLVVIVGRIAKVMFFSPLGGKIIDTVVPFRVLYQSRRT